MILDRYLWFLIIENNMETNPVKVKCLKCCSIRNISEVYELILSGWIYLVELTIHVGIV